VSCVLRAETAAVAPKSSHHHLSFIGPPAAATGEASGVTADSATLHGTVTPNGASTSAGFEYSISPTLSPAIPTPVTPMGSGTAPVPVSSAVAGLGPATTYYFRAVASNAQGSRRGEIKSFTTAAAPAVAVAVAGAAAAAPGLGTLPPGSPGDGLTNCATAVSVGNNGTVKLCDATNPPTVSTSQTLTGTLPAKLEALAAKRKKRKKPRPAVLARGQTTIPAGETRAVELKLGAKHRRALARRGRVVVEAVIEATGPGGVTTVKKSVSLQAGKKKRKRG